MLIAGSFREYPFSLLLEIFLRRGETGLLEVSSSKNSGYFYIKNGKVKDGQIGNNTGLAALELAGKFDDGSFRFKPFAPSDYARVVWQRSFGPTGTANDASSTKMFVRQLLVYSRVASHGIQRLAVSLLRRCVASGLVLWKRAQIGTRLLRSFKYGLAALQHRRRHERHLSSVYSYQLHFRPPSLTTCAGEVMPDAVQQGIAQYVVFAFIVTVLLATSVLMLHQLVFGDQDLKGAGTVDEQVDIPVNATPTRSKPKRHRSKRRHIDKAKDNSEDKRSTDKKRGVKSTQQAGASS